MMDKLLFSVIFTALFDVFLPVKGLQSLLLSTRNDIRLVEVSPLGVSKTNTIIIDNFTGIAAVDFIYSDSSVFWTDIELKTIKRAWLNGSEDIRNVISTDLESPDGLATDWLGKKLYWVDSEKKRIEVSELDGRSRLVLFWYNLDMPRAIALDPQRGYMFWSDVGETPKIERAGMDGSGRLVLIYRDIFWPNGLTIDYEDSRIYWIDARLNYIGSCNYEGNEIFSYRKKKRILHPSALTFFNRTWFWTDWMTRSVHSLTEWSNFEVVFKSVHEPMDIHVYCGERQSKGLHEIPCNLNNGGCSHLCLLSPMSPYFKCACPTGVKMRDDNKTCADDVEEFLLVSTRRSIRMISLHTPDYSQLILPLKDLVHVIAIDYDPVESRIYWTDSESNSISTSHLNGTGQNVVIGSEIKDPDGMAVDWIGRNLYWTDTGYDTIQVSRLNGSFRTVLIDTGLDEPRVIRVDPLSGLMFWTDWGKNPKIERANMDGSSRIVLVESSLGWPNGLSIDREEKNIYWADAKKDKLEVATFDGRRRRVLKRLPGSHVFSLSLLGENLYWTDWQWRHVSRINKQTQISSIIAEQIPDIMGVKAVNIRENTGTNECAMDNFGCSHLCLVRQHSFPRCACPNGFELDSEGKICLEEKATLFLTNGNGFNKMNLGMNSRRLISVPKETKNVLVFDIHIGENRIYWIDAADKNILRSFINDTVVEHVVKNGLDYPEDIALDWLSSNVYWTDLGTRRIEVVRCDGSSRKVLLWKNLGYVTTLTVDPNTGYMFWTNWINPFSIERAALDGSGRKILLQNLQRAYGLTIDYSDGRLYWANSGRCIESSDIEGNNRTCVVEEDIGHPTSITMYGDNLVWIDWQKQTIEQAEKRTGCNRTVLQTGMGTMMDVFAHYSQKQLGQNACQYNNGGCSHLCLPLPSGDQSNTTHKCACPTHYILNEDNISCSAPSSYLLFSQKIQINRLVLPTNATQDEISDTIITTLPIVGLKSIRALSYDPVDRNIYVIDRKTKSINRFNDSEIQATTVLANGDKQFKPYDLDIEPFSRLLFWTCSKTNVISILRLNLTSVGVVVRGDGERPRSIAIDPINGFMYWINMVSPPTIEEAEFDGSRRSTLLSLNLGRPGQLTIDILEETLYWADSRLQRIESYDLSYGKRRLLVDGDMGDPKGIAVLGEYLYWIDRKYMVLERISKVTGKGRTNIKILINELSDIYAVQNLSLYNAVHHPCVNDNGGCSHICHRSRTGSSTAICSCPLTHRRDYSFSKQCLVRKSCKFDQFECRSGPIFCIPRVWRCDGSPECVDSSDEEGCA